MPEEIKQTPQARGDQFELLVARLYEALGYRVVRNISLANHQIDLLATRSVEGAADLRVIIEAKSRSEDNVGIKDVTAFANVIKDLCDRNLATSGVIVTDRDFTQHAQGAAHGNPRIRLARLGDLEEELLLGVALLHKTKVELEKKPAQKSYMRLSGELWAGTRREELRDVCAYAEAWANSGQGLLTLLGDFGSGKTTLVERLFIKAAAARLTTQRGRYPILLKLRSLRQHVDLWSFVAVGLSENQFFTATRGTFFDQLAKGTLLVLLDGFDEVHTGANAAERGDYLSRLAPLFQSPSGCILTSRPTYFESRMEMTASLNRHLVIAPRLERVPERTRGGVDLTRQLALISSTMGLGAAQSLSSDALSLVVELHGLRSEQIKAYVESKEQELRQVTGMSASEVLTALYAIYHIDDLMTRPMLLTLILEIVINRAVDLKDSRQALGPAMIYEISTQMSLTRDMTRGEANQYLDVVQRSEVCRQLALKMLERDNIELTASDVTEAIRNANLPVVREARAIDLEDIVERIHTDVRVCSFLVFSESGSLTFAHRSYGEFFLALYVHLAIVSPARFPRPPFSKLSWEVIYFLASYAHDRAGFWPMARLALTNEGVYDQAQRNCLARVAFASGASLEGKALRNVVVDQIYATRVKIGPVELAGVTFSNAELRNCTLEHWQAKEAAMHNVRIVETSIATSTLELDVKDTWFDKCEIVDSALTIHAGPVHVSDTTARNASVLFKGTYLISHMTAIDSSLCLFTSGNGPSSSSVVASRCRLKGRIGSAWISFLSGSRLDECLIAGLALTDDESSKLVAGKAGVVGGVAWLSRCRGVLLLSGVQALVTKEKIEELGRSFPELAIAHLEWFHVALEKLEILGRAKRPAVSEAVELLTREGQMEMAKVFAMIQRQGWLEDEGFSEWRKIIAQ